MEFLKNFFEYLIDKDRRLSAKAAMLIIGVLTVLLINDVTGFTYYYNSRCKIEQVKALNEIVLNDSTPIDIKTKAKALELAILGRKTAPDIASDYTFRYYQDLQRSLRSQAQEEDVVYTKARSSSTDRIFAAPEPRNNFLFLMSASGVFVFLSMLMIPLSISIGFDKGFATALAALVGINLLIAMLGGIFYFLLDLIPQIGKTWTWNYVISFVIQMVMLTLTVHGITLANKKSAAA